MKADPTLTSSKALRLSTRKAVGIEERSTCFESPSPAGKKVRSYEQVQVERTTPPFFLRTTGLPTSFLMKKVHKTTKFSPYTENAVVLPSFDELWSGCFASICDLEWDTSMLFK